MERRLKSRVTKQNTSPLPKGGEIHGQDFWGGRKDHCYSISFSIACVLISCKRNGDDVRADSATVSWVTGCRYIRR